MRCNATADKKRVARIVSISLLFLLQIWLCLVHVPWLDPPNDVAPPLPVNRLRRDWTIIRSPHHSFSPLAQQLYQHQQDCTLPRADFWFRNRFGLGSDLHVWSQAACNALQHKVRIRTIGPWIWQSQADCSSTTLSTTSSRDSLSTMACYFPVAEPDCPVFPESTTVRTQSIQGLNLTRGGGVLLDNTCRDFREQRNVTVSAWRAAAMEYLFFTLSPQLQFEANRQLHLVFPHGVVPSKLITVHIRWGDKEDEMKLVPITEYIRAVKDLAQGQEHDVHVYLSTTDPRAVYEFVSQSPSEWNIYIDAYFQEYHKHQKSADRQYNANPLLSSEHNGKPGFVALASLLVALEANAFVLTTASNWSRLLNELRKTILDSECNYCTRVVDLRPGEW